MSSFTCISCRVAFADGEVQRAHYKTDWHRYNLKRKVADMVPVTADDFQERVLAQRAAADRLLSAAADAGESCSACSKRFSSSNAFQNHLRSHKHRQEEKRALLAVRQKEDHMNRKNQEKGLGEEEGEKEGEEEEEEEEEKEEGGGTPVDHDSHNEALRLALREQQKADPARGEEGEARGGGAAKRPRAEKPPRLVWLEEQARRGGEPEAPEAQEAQDGGAVPPVTSDPQVVLPGSLPVTDCLFCPHRSRSLLRNVAHMTRHHGFFLPDPEFLVDLRGLVRYLGEKVGAGNVCLWCNERGRSFYSTAAVQGHMTDKSHCKLLTDGDAALEFADFYDFRSSYPDQKEGEDGDLDSLPDDKDMLYDDDSPLELTLPSGARIGHRSLMRYYKQRFGAQRAVVLAHNQNAVGRVLRHYRALGWSADRGKSGFHTNARDMPYVQKLKSRWMLKVGMTNNKCKQHYFRAQVMF
ncbi:hypothetical protein NHX12_003882 [Muraenolepis orangiensis]|uniref:C2H2-type domain-containing protein n=1 Tax=Muraenolepis orangiensis TaxID=630683 RepID=A0A9Q0DWQ6_9TELE|nr:hypothetical protein NHX12_003882 [Muraenolepis orangiensis]